MAINKPSKVASPTPTWTKMATGEAAAEANISVAPVATVSEPAPVAAPRAVSPPIDVSKPIALPSGFPQQEFVADQSGKLVPDPSYQSYRYPASRIGGLAEGYHWVPNDDPSRILEGGGWTGMTVGTRPPPSEVMLTADQVRNLTDIVNQFREGIRSGGLAAVPGQAFGIAAGTPPELLRAFGAGEELIQRVQAPEYLRATQVVAEGRKGPEFIVEPSEPLPFMTEEEWGKKVEAGGIKFGSPEARTLMYRQFLAANVPPEEQQARGVLSAPVVEVGSITPDSLSVFLGAEVGDKYAVLATGEKIIVSGGVDIGDRFIQADVGEQVRSVEQLKVAQQAARETQEAQIAQQQTIQEAQVAQAAREAEQSVQDKQRLEQEFLNENDMTQRAMILSGTVSPDGRYTEPGFSASYADLPEADKDRVLSAYASASAQWQEARKPENIAKLAIGFIPIVGTVALWNDMDNTWRAVSIATDAIIVAPIISRVVGSVLRSTEAAKVASALKVDTSEARGALRAVDPSLVKPFDNFVKAQSDYARLLTDMKQAEKYLSEYGSVVEDPESIVEAIGRAKAALPAAEQEVITAANKFSGAQLSSTKAAFDSPAIAEQVAKDFPNDSVRAIKQLVNEVVNPSEAITLKQATIDYNNALHRVTELSARANLLERRSAPIVSAWKANPEKVAADYTRIQERLANVNRQLGEANMDLMAAQARLNIARTGDIQAVASRLAKARQEIGNLTREAAVRKGKGLSTSELEKRLEALRVTESKLAADVGDRVRHLEIEWAKPKTPSGGRLMVATKPSRVGVPSVRVVGEGVRRAGIAGLVLAEIARAVSSAGVEEAVAPEKIVRPAEVPEVSPAVSPEISPAEVAKVSPARTISVEEETRYVAGQEPAVAPSVRQLQEQAQKTQVEAAVEEATKTVTAQQLAAKAAVRPALRAELKTIVPVPVPRQPKVPIKGGPAPVFLESRAPIAAGSWAWKQGAFWKYVPPPWDQERPITLPKGVVPIGAINTHLRTPQETIQVIGSSESPVPESASIDLGVVDVFITDYGRRISFMGKGTRTDVGERIPRATQGMSIPAIENIVEVRTGAGSIRRHRPLLRRAPEPRLQARVGGVKL